MRHGRLAAGLMIVLIVVLAGSLDTSTNLEEQMNEYPVHLYAVTCPLVARHWGPPPRTSAKKGAVLFGDPMALPLLGVSWAVVPGDLPLDWPAGIEPVMLLSHAAPIERAIGSAAPIPTKAVMVWNEPDSCGVSPERAAVMFAELQARHPDHDYVVPNVAADVDYVRSFASAYQRYSGDPLPSSVALSVHCYLPAGACIQRLEKVKDLARELGLGRIWVTEFGAPLTPRASMADRAEDTACLVDYMEREPMVERYAYFATMIPDGLIGPGCALDPTVGWIPLAYPYHDQAPPTVRRTFMGDWYACHIPLAGTLDCANTQPTVGRIANPTHPMEVVP